MLKLFPFTSRCSAFDVALVFLAVLLSKSLYFESFSNNIILLPFFICSFALTIISNKINVRLLLFFLIFIFVILINDEVRTFSFVSLMMRLWIAIFLVSYLSFETFTKIFTDLVLVIGVVSLLTFPIIFFDIDSPLPDFIAIDGRYLRNFLFFGVSENFIEYKIYRNSGLWWEPGAFQIFVMLAFFFSIINKEVSKSKYFLFLVVIFSTQSTAGIFLFFFLSIYLIFQKASLLQINILLLFFVFAVVFILVPEIDDKFNGEGFHSASSRVNDVLISFELLMDNLWFGYGYGNQIEVAIPFGEKLLGYDNYHSLSKPTGSDGLTMFISQVGIFGVLLLLPFLFPSYIKKRHFLTRVYFSVFLFLLFNTQNFVFFLIFEILLVYGAKDFLSNGKPYHIERRSKNSVLVSIN